MVIRPFAQLAAAAVTVGLLVVAGNVLGRLADRNNAPVGTVQPTPPSTRQPSPGRAPSLAHSPSLGPVPSTGPAVSTGPTPTHTAAASPIQVVGIQPPRIADGEGPFGSIVGTGSNTVALTFDDGPTPDWTPQILQALRESDIKATFCVVGENVEAHPEIVRAIVADGHTLCNHTWDHNLLLGDLSERAMRADMQRTNAAIQAASPGAQISYFRAPGGNWTAPIVEAARHLGMASLDWAVDPRDWTVPTTAAIARRITAGCVTGAIFLLHDGGGDRSRTVEAVREFLPKLSSGNTFIALPTGGA